MNEFDAQEAAYRNGFAAGFKCGVDQIEKFLLKYPIHKVMILLQNKEELCRSVSEGVINNDFHQ